MILLTLFLLFAASSEASICAYSCKSLYPALYGRTNLAPGAYGLPSVRHTGFSPAAETRLCADDQKYDFTTIPLPARSSQSLSSASENFLALCQGPTERGLKFFTVTEDDNFQLQSVNEVPGEGEILGMSTVREVVLVLTADSLFHYAVDDAAEGVLSLQTEYNLESATGTGASDPFVPIFTGTHAVVVLDGSVFAAPLDGSGAFSIIETEFSPINGYAVAVNEDIVVFMTNVGLVKVEISSESSESISFGDGSIGAVAATSADSLLVMATNGDQTYLSEVNVESFDSFEVFGEYDFVADGMSRAGYRLHGTGDVALVSLTTDKGLVVVAQQYGDLYPKGTIYAHYDTAYALTGKPTVTVLGEPVVFGSESAIAFTKSHTVKFYSTENDDTFLPSPILLGQTRAIGVTAEGAAVLFTWCERYQVGEEEPEGSCPFADLPVDEEDAWWMTMMAGAAAVIAVPVAGEYACLKMKVRGASEEDGEEKPRRKRHRQSEGAKSIPLTPMRKQ